MENSKCYIVGAGEHYGEYFKPLDTDFVIGADGGYEYIKSKNIRCDLVIGDFDSVDKKPNHKNVIQLNPIKDETDMLSAVNIGLEKGYKQFYIYGGMGGRLEHTIANIQMMTKIAKLGGRAYLYGKKEILTVIHNDKIEFDETYSGYVSVFSLSSVSKGVNEINLKYKLDDYTMTNDYAIGVSNEFQGIKSKICVKDGTLLVIIENNY